MTTDESVSLLEGAPDRFELGECQSIPSDLTHADVAVAAETISIRERYEGSGLPWVGEYAIMRPVDLTGVRVIRNTAKVPVDSALTLVTFEASAYADRDGLSELASFTTVAFDDVPALKDVVVTFGLPPLDWEEPSVIDPDAPWRMANVFGRGPDGIDFAGPCTGVLKLILDQMAPLLDYSDSYDLMVDWLSVMGTPDAQRFQAAEDVVYANLNAPPDWNTVDPRVRSLNPIDVPPEIQDRLEVRAALVDITGLTSGQVVALRTTSGVSSGIAPGAMGSVIPLFYVQGDTTVDIVIADPADMANGRVIATLDLDQLADQGGIRVQGTLDNAEITVMTRDDVGKQLNMTDEQLTDLQLQYLGRTNQDAAE